MAKAIYPGTFDPITFGHISVVRRALVIFDEVIIAVAKDIPKEPFFSIDERVEMIEDIFSDEPRVSVEAFSGLLVDYVRKKGVRAILRGLRSVSDFEYEFQMALANRKLASDIETVFIMAEEHVSYFSSSLVKEVATLGGCLDGLVPEPVIRKFSGKR